MYPNCTYSNLQKWSYMVLHGPFTEIDIYFVYVLWAVNCLVNTHVTVGTLAF